MSLTIENLKKNINIFITLIRLFNNDKTTIIINEIKLVHKII